VRVCLLRPGVAHVAHEPAGNFDSNVRSVVESFRQAAKNRLHPLRRQGALRHGAGFVGLAYHWLSMVTCV